MKTMKKIILALLAVMIMITASFAGICTQKHLSRLAATNGAQVVFDHVSEGFGEAGFMY